MVTILVVEDEPHQQMLYQMELEEEGYRVLLASDGREGLRRLEMEQPNLVVLDLSLPEMDGIHLLGRMRDVDPRLPIVINSAYEWFKDNYMTWAADAWVVKSSDVGILKAEIRRVLLDRIEPSAGAPESCC